MKTSEFDYNLPSSLIAQSPLEKRSDSKLLILNKYSGEIKHQKFSDIVNFLSEKDVLVLNNTKVLPARIYGIKEETNAKIEVLLLKEIEKDIWQCLIKPQKRVKLGTKIKFKDDFFAEVLELYNDGITNIKMYYKGVFLENLNECGIMPLPPYIHERLENNDRYQTVYAKNLGSVAAPTAGLHFTNEILNKLKEKGVTIVNVTLHVGIGTFRPVIEEDISKHKMHSEYYEISKEAEEILNKSLNEGKRIICVGTTALRVVESNYTKYGKIKETKEETNIFIYPGYKFKCTDALITNFHLPKSTLLMLVSALCSKEIIMNAYNEAIKHEYRFFSFGDAMFIENTPSKYRKEYNNNLKEFKNKKVQIKKDNFKIITGENNIILSAPHAFKQERNSNIKKNEYNTGTIVKLMHIIKKTHAIYVYKDEKVDHNFENTIYRKLLSKYINDNKIKYLIDIHGLEKKEKFDIIIGTNNFNNVNGDIELIKSIEKIFKNNLSEKVFVDKKYSSKGNTISTYINKNNNIKTIQIEISKNYRKFKKRPKSFNKLIMTLEKVLNLLERWDKNE